MNYIPYYTASTTFTVSIKEEIQGATGSSNTYYDNSAAEQLSITFPYILTSGVLQRRVAASLGQPRVYGTIHAATVPETNLLTLSVRDTDPERAYNTLRAVIDNYPALSEVIVGKVRLNILDETGVPTTPDNSKDILGGVKKGAIAGAAVGLVWALLVTLLRRTIRREEDFPRFVNQRCLGSTPYIQFKERSQQTEYRINILEENLANEYKEAIRIIRNKVERSARENGLKTILITSALAGEGKSTIAVNLALSMAQEGKKVALVDCDLRNPSDSAIMGVSLGMGLIDYLRDIAPFADCMYSSKALGLPENMKFVFVPGGKAVGDGSRYMGGERMRAVVRSLSEYADYVILDCAPVGLLTDASILAEYADGAIFVAKKDFAKASHMINGLEHLAEGNVHMIGCVLNGDK
jgi:capsular exopolysaccharide synthesis family protein